MRLTADMVRAIFAQRPESREHLGPSPGVLCMRFGVTEKTVRDIWSGRTWNHLTGALSRAPYCGRRPGRPRQLCWADSVFAEETVI